MDKIKKIEKIIKLTKEGIEFNKLTGEAKATYEACAYEMIVELMEGKDA